jgi:hypothetical protein
MVLDALDRVLEELERIANPRELVLLFLAVTMVAFGAVVGPTDTVSIALIVIGSGMFFVGIFLPVLTEFQIGPGGFSGKLRERDQEVQATLEPHTEGLMHTAELLAGNPEAGKELLERALVDTYLQWREAKQEGPVDSVRRRLDDLARLLGEANPGVAAEMPLP